MVRASARYARSGVHGAYDVQEGHRVGGVERCMAEKRACLAPRRRPLNVKRHAPKGFVDLQFPGEVPILGTNAD